MGRFRANMHHGNGNADGAGCLSALFLYGLGGATGNGCSSMGCAMWVVVLSPLMFIINLAKGDTMGAWFFGIITAIVVIVVVGTVINIIHEDRQRKREEQKLDEN